MCTVNMIVCLMVFGTQLLRENVKHDLPSQILKQNYQAAGVVRNLSVMFDSELSLQHQVASVCKSCFTGLRDLRRIRCHLSKAAAISLANALISKLDYCTVACRKAI